MEVLAWCTQVLDTCLVLVEVGDGGEKRVVLVVDVHHPVGLWSGWQFPKSGSVACALLRYLRSKIYQFSADRKICQTHELIVNTVTKLKEIFADYGLLPIYIDPSIGTQSYYTITSGAMGDSFYECLLKVWIQGNRTSAVKQYRSASLIRRTTPSSFTHSCEKDGDTLTDKMGELACFARRILALVSFGYGPDDSLKFLLLAEELAWTYYNFYQSTATKLAGENYFFHDVQVQGQVHSPLTSSVSSYTLFHLRTCTKFEIKVSTKWKAREITLTMRDTNQKEVANMSNGSDKGKLRPEWRVVNCDFFFATIMIWLGIE
ncbi:hypothetical protein FNV43_RR21011 [Rhamnella rubrinervis]|uniref:alpha-1,2-Mannosidase n=1 Tax=Rhamnella rubrinervis TaxID=2594499 RepID=A0A8K0GXH4_9ROSA|nr:hypothetical protein FNV43_RR21011 [Rhamnella rubrinervis]